MMKAEHPGVDFTMNRVNGFFVNNANYYYNNNNSTSSHVETFELFSNISTDI